MKNKKRIETLLNVDSETITTAQGKTRVINAFVEWCERVRDNSDNTLHLYWDHSLVDPSVPWCRSDAVARYLRSHGCNFVAVGCTHVILWDRGGAVLRVPLPPWAKSIVHFQDQQPSHRLRLRDAYKHACFILNNGVV